MHRKLPKIRPPSLLHTTFRQMRGGGVRSNIQFVSCICPLPPFLIVRAHKFDNHATFSPLVLSAAGGLARVANIFYKRLASMHSSKWDHSYSSTLCWLRCHLSFSLLRSSIQAIRGARSSCGRSIRMPMVFDLVNSESHLS